MMANTTVEETLNQWFHSQKEEKSNQKRWISYVFHRGRQKWIQYCLGGRLWFPWFAIYHRYGFLYPKLMRMNSRDWFTIECSPKSVPAQWRNLRMVQFCISFYWSAETSFTVKVGVGGRVFEAALTYDVVRRALFLFKSTTVPSVLAEICRFYS